MGKSDIILSSDSVAAVAMEDSTDRDDDHTASEEEGPHDFASAESGESDSEEGSIGAGALLDLEASESGREDAESDDDDDDHDDGGMSTWSHDNSSHTSFPQFCRLPIELRQRIWEFFDLDLRAPARVFDVHVVGDCLWPSGTLEQQTEPARTLLEVHRESRQMGLKFYPDTLPILNRKGFMRYHKDRDIIFLRWMTDSMDWESSRWRHIAGDLKHVKNLAFEVKPDIHMIGIFGDLPFHNFASLQKVYPCWDAFDLHTRNLKWCVSDMVHIFHVKTEEQEPGLGEDIEALYCWPNLEKHAEFAEKEIPKDIRLSRNTEEAGEQDIELWPMVLFSSYEGPRRYNRLRERALADPDAAWDSESSSESGDDSSEVDEYESEGIDDATIDDSDDDNEAGLDDLVVQHISSDDEDEGGSGFNGFSPQRDALAAFSGVVDLTGEFSSLEPESPKDAIPVDSDSDEGSDPDEEEPVRQIKRPRRQVISSDSEDEPADTPVGKLTQKQSRPPNRRAGRVVLSDSDDSDGGEDNGADTKGKDFSRTEESDATSDDDSAEDSDEEEEVAEEIKKPMSLAERLRLFRSDNPVPQAGLDSASEDAGGSESFYQDAAEDDDGLGEGGAYGDDEEISRNDLVMDMAEDESDGDNEDEW